MTSYRTLSISETSVLWRWTNSTPDAAAKARVALRCALEQLDYESEVIQDLVIAVSELVANATEHAVGPYEMRLRRTDSGMACEVEDRDPRIPGIPALRSDAPLRLETDDDNLEGLCSLLSERGRGLHIVNVLTKGLWGFRTGTTTKTAWLALPAPPCG